MTHALGDCESLAIEGLVWVVVVVVWAMGAGGVGARRLAARRTHEGVGGARPAATPQSPVACYSYARDREESRQAYKGAVDAKRSNFVYVRRKTRHPITAGDAGCNCFSHPWPYVLR